MNAVDTWELRAISYDVDAMGSAALVPHVVRMSAALRAAADRIDELEKRSGKGKVW